MDLNKIFIFVTLVSVFLAQGQTEKIEKLIKIDQKAPGMAIAVNHNGKYVYSKTFGKANLDYDAPINENTVFDVSALAMHITASCILKLEDEGKLSLSDDIRKYLSDLPNYEKGVVRINHLLNHTSGIMSYLIALNMSGKSWNSSYTNEDAFSLIKQKKSLGFAPGQEYEYSDSNYLLLSEIISKVSGKPHWEFAKEHLFEPLGMHRTFYYHNPNQVVKNKAIGYQKIDNSFEVNHNFNFAAYGDGRLYSSLDDLKRWASNLNDNKLLIKNLEQRLTQHGTRNNGDKLSYAFGLEHGIERRHVFFAHSGYWAGFSAMFLKFPELNLWVLTLSNNSSLSAPNIAYDVAGVILDNYPKEEEFLKPFKVSRKKLREYEGNFIGYKNGYLREIKIINDTLNYIESENRKYKLRPLAKHRFKVLGTITNYTIDFESGNDNKINGMQFLRNGYLMYQYEKYNPINQDKWSDSWKKYLGVYKNNELEITYELKKGEKKGIDLFVNGKKLMNYLPVMNGLFSSESTHHGYLKFSTQGDQFTLSDYSFKPILFRKITKQEKIGTNSP